MKKETDKLQLKPVPVFRQEELTLFEYIEKIEKYCIYIHNEIKDFGFEILDAKVFYMYLCRMSYEPQYRVLRTINMKKVFYKETENAMWSAEDVAELFSIIEDLKDYIKSLNQQTYERLHIRAIAEAYYMDGLSTREITETLIKLKLLPEYNAKNNPIDHERTIARWVKTFKDYDVLVKPKKH